MRETVRTHSVWYLAQGVLMIAAGAIAIIHPVATTAALVILLGWLMIFGGLIVFFLIVEPHGLARLWQIGKEKLRLWPFPH